MQRFLYICLAWMSATTVLLAADFWEKKKFSEWNEKEVRRMLDDWAVARPKSARTAPRARGTKTYVNEILL